MVGRLTLRGGLHIRDRLEVERKWPVTSDFAAFKCIEHPRVKERELRLACGGCSYGSHTKNLTETCSCSATQWLEEHPHASQLQVPASAGESGKRAFAAGAARDLRTKTTGRDTQPFGSLVWL